MPRARFNAKNPKHRRYAKERARGRTQREAAKRAGYKGRHPIGNDLETDPATLMAIGEELRKAMGEEEARNLRAAQARGHAPTKVVHVDEQGNRIEYDTADALEDVLRMHGLFKDRQILTGPDDGPIVTKAEVAFYLPDNGRRG
jgi:phage terminase small subunit